MEFYNNIIPTKHKKTVYNNNNEIKRCNCNSEYNLYNKRNTFNNNYNNNDIWSLLTEEKTNSDDYINTFNLKLLNDQINHLESKYEEVPSLYSIQNESEEIPISYENYSEEEKCFNTSSTKKRLKLFQELPRLALKELQAAENESMLDENMQNLQISLPLKKRKIKMFENETCRSSSTNKFCKRSKEDLKPKRHNPYKIDPLSIIKPTKFKRTRPSEYARKSRSSALRNYASPE